MPLADPHRATQIFTTNVATIHYQMALPIFTDETFFLTINAPHQASCIQVPRQIPRPDLITLLPG